MVKFPTWSITAVVKVKESHALYGERIITFYIAPKIHQGMERAEG